MSNIDERILAMKMKFDNRDFEKNVTTSLGTLQKLKEALNFKDVESRLDNLEKNVNKIDFSGITNNLSSRIDDLQATINSVDFSNLTNNVESLSKRFTSFTGMLKGKILEDIVGGIEGKVVGFFRSISANTIGQIKTGGERRATNIDKAKFQIEGLGYAWEELYESMDKAVTGTAFGIDAAASAAAQLVASNVGVGEEMTNALTSISNVAAQTGSSYEEIAHIYTAIAGNGRVMSEQLNQFSYRGLNAAAMLGKAMGKTEAEVRDMTSKGEIDFKTFSDAMLEALGDNAAKANSTFEGSMENMKAALSRIGQPFYKTYRDAMIPIFNRIREIINDINKITKPISLAFDRLAKKASNLFLNVFAPGKIDYKWLEGLTDTIGHLADWIDKLMSKITPLWSDTVFYMQEIKEATMPAVEAIDKAYVTLAGFEKSAFAPAQVTKAMDELGIKSKKAQEEIDNASHSILEWKDGTVNSKSAIDETNESIEKQITLLERVQGALSRWIEVISDFFAISDEEDEDNGLTTFIEGLVNTLEILVRTAIVVVDSALDPLLYAFQGIGDTVKDLATTLGYWMTQIKEALGVVDEGTEDYSAYSQLHDILSTIFYTIARVIRAGAKLISFLGTNVINILGAIITKAIEISGTIRGVFRDLKNSEGFKRLEGGIQNVVGKIMYLKQAAQNFINGIVDGIRNFQLPTDTIEKFKNFIESAAEEFGNILSMITGKIDIDAIFSGLSTVLQTVLSIGGKVFGFLADIAMTVGPILLNALTKAVGLILDFGTKIKDFFKTVGESEGFKKLAEVAEKVKKILIDLKEKALDRIQAFFKKFKAKSIKLPTEPFKKFADAVGKVAGKVAEFVESLIGKIDVEKVLDTIGSVLLKIGEVVSTVVVKGFEILSALFKVLVDLAGKAVNAFKDLWATFKESKAFETLTNFFGNLGEALGNAKDAIGNFVNETIENIQNGEFKLPEISWDTIKTAFENAKAWLIEKWTGFTAWLSEKWKSLTGGENGEGGIELPTFDAEGIKKAITGAIEWIKEKLEALTGFISSILFGDPVEASEIDGYVEGVTDAVNEVGDKAKKAPGILDNLVTSIGKLGGETALAGLNALTALVSAIGDVLSKGIELGGQAFTSGIGFVSDFFEGLEEHKDLVTIIKDIAVSIAKLFAIYRAVDAINGITSALGRLGDIFKSIEGLIKGVTKSVETVSKATARELNARAILEIAGAIFVIALAFRALANLSPEQLKNSAIVIGGIAAAIAILYKVFSKSGDSENANPMATALEKISESLKSFGKSLKPLGKGIQRLGTAALLGSFALTVAILIGILKSLKDVQWYQMEDAVAIMTVVIGEIVGAIKALNAFNGKRSFGNQLGVAAELIALTLAIKSIAKTLIKLKDVKKEDLDKAVDAINSITFVALKLSLIGGYDKSSSFYGSGRKGMEQNSSSKTNSKWKTILATAALVWVVGSALAKLAALDSEKLKGATKAIESVMESVLGVMAASIFITDSHTASGGKKSGGLFKGKLANGRKDWSSSTDKVNKGYNNIIKIAILIGVVAVSLYALSNVNSRRLEAATDAIESVLSTTVALLSASIFVKDTDKNGNTKENKAWQNIAAICAVIAVTALAIGLLAGTTSAKKMQIASKAIDSILNTCIGIIGASALIKKKGKEGGTSSENTGWQTILATAGLIAIIAGSLALLATQDVAAIEAAGQAVATVALVTIGVLAAVGLIIGGISDIGGKGLEGLKEKFGVVGAALLAIVGTLGSVVLAFKLLTDMDVEPKKFESVGVGLFEALLGIATVMASMSMFGGINFESTMIVGIITGIMAALKGIEDLINYIFGTDFKFYEEIVQRLGDALYDLGHLINRFISGVFGTENIGDDIKQGAKDLGSGMDSFGDSMNDAIGGLPDTIGGIMEKIKSFDFAGLMDSIGAGIKRIPAIMYDVAVDMNTFAAEAGKIDSDDVDNMIQVFKLLAGAALTEAVTAIIENLVGEDGGLVAITKKLNGDVATNLLDFLGKIEGMDGTELDAMATLMETLGKIAVLDFLTGTLEWLVGKAGITSVTENLPAFAQAMADFNDEIADKSFDTTKIKKVAEAGKAIVDVANALPRKGGLAQKLIGEKNLRKFSVAIKSFGRAIASVSDEFEGKTFNKEAIEQAAEAGMALSKLENSLPRAGGKLQKWIGSKNIAVFGVRLVKFIQYIQQASGILNSSEAAGIDVDAIDAAANAGMLLSNLEHSLPRSGGKLQDWIGEKSLADFGKRMVTFARGIVYFSRITSGNIDQDAVNVAADCGMILSSLENGLRAHDGVAQFFTGDANIEDFGKGIVGFGRKMVEFSNVLTGKGEGNTYGLDADAIERGVKVFNGLWTFVKRVEGAADDADTMSDRVADFMLATEGFEDIVGVMRDFYEHIGEAMDDPEITGKLIENADKAGEAVVGYLHDGIKKALDADSKEGSSIDSIGDVIKNALLTNKSKSNLRIAGLGVGTAIKEGIILATGDPANESSVTESILAKPILGSFAIIIEKILSVMEEADEKFKNRGKNWGLKILEGLKYHFSEESGARELISARDTLVNSSEAKLEEQTILDRFFDIGKTWSQQILDGLISQEQDITNRLTTLADNVANSLSDMENSINNSAASNIDSSITSADKSFDRSAQSITDSVNDSSRNFLSQIGASINKGLADDLDTNPVITPILDLSQIQNGSNMLTNIVGNSLTGVGDLSLSNTGSLLNAAITDRGKGYDEDKTPTADPETLSALNGIRTDIKELSDYMSQMDVRLDSGTLVGELGTRMDHELGNIQKFRERWA